MSETVDTQEAAAPVRVALRPDVLAVLRGIEETLEEAVKLLRELVDDQRSL